MSKKKVLRAKDNATEMSINQKKIEIIIDNLPSAFNWEETKEGFAYWDRIFKRLNKFVEISFLSNSIIDDAFMAGVNAGFNNSSGLTDGEMRLSCKKWKNSYLRGGS